MRKTLQKANELLKWNTPPSIHQPEEVQEVVDVESNMIVGSAISGRVQLLQVSKPISEIRAIL